MRSGKILSVVILAFGVLFYLGSVSGMLWKAATPPGDVGLLATSGIFVLFGLVGLLLKDAPANN